MTKYMAKFTVHGEDLTRLARDIWNFENKPLAALNILRSLDGITDAQCLDILGGKMKLTGDSSSGINIEPDNASGQKTLDTILGDFQKNVKQLEEYLLDATEMAIGDTVGVGSSQGLIQVPRNQTELRQGRRTLKKESKWGDADEKPELIAHKEITSMYGWLSPSGKFYECRYGGHNQLALDLGHDEINLEDFGWVKCTSELDRMTPAFYGFYIDCKKKPTDAQKRLVTEYCAKNKIEVPYWIDC